MVVVRWDTPEGETGQTTPGRLKMSRYQPWAIAVDKDVA
jgi:hypothetical protein